MYQPPFYPPGMFQPVAIVPGPRPAEPPTPPSSHNPSTPPGDTRSPPVAQGSIVVDATGDDDDVTSVSTQQYAACHMCSICGRRRSGGYHELHPVIPGKPPLNAPCRRCEKRGINRSDRTAVSSFVEDDTLPRIFELDEHQDDVEHEQVESRGRSQSRASTGTRYDQWDGLHIRYSRSRSLPAFDHPREPSTRRNEEIRFRHVRAPRHVSCHEEHESAEWNECTEHQEEQRPSPPASSRSHRTVRTVPEEPFPTGFSDPEPASAHKLQEQHWEDEEPAAPPPESIKPLSVKSDAKSNKSAKSRKGKDVDMRIIRSVRYVSPRRNLTSTHRRMAEDPEKALYRAEKEAERARFEAERERARHDEEALREEEERTVERERERFEKEQAQIEVEEKARRWTFEEENKEAKRARLQAEQFRAHMKKDAERGKLSVKQEHLDARKKSSVTGSALRPPSDTSHSRRRPRNRRQEQSFESTTAEQGRYHVTFQTPSPRERSGASPKPPLPNNKPVSSSSERPSGRERRRQERRESSEQIVLDDKGKQTQSSYLRVSESRAPVARASSLTQACAGLILYPFDILQSSRSVSDPARQTYAIPTSWDDARSNPPHSAFRSHPQSNAPSSTQTETTTSKVSQKLHKREIVVIRRTPSPTPSKRSAAASSRKSNRLSEALMGEGDYNAYAEYHNSPPSPRVRSPSLPDAPFMPPRAPSPPHDGSRSNRIVDV
jgi:hypothetical protein